MHGFLLSYITEQFDVRPRFQKVTLVLGNASNETSFNPHAYRFGERIERFQIGTRGRSTVYRANVGHDNLRSFVRSRREVGERRRVVSIRNTNKLALRLARVTLSKFAY